MGVTLGTARGESISTSGTHETTKFGERDSGQVLLVDRTLLILTEEGELVHVQATPDRPNRVLGRLQALEGPTWNNFALYGAYVVLRNGREAAVYRLPLEG